MEKVYDFKILEHVLFLHYLLFLHIYFCITKIWNLLRFKMSPIIQNSLLKILSQVLKIIVLNLVWTPGSSILEMWAKNIMWFKTIATISHFCTNIFAHFRSHRNIKENSIDNIQRLQEVNFILIRIICNFKVYYIETLRKDI